MLIDTLFLLMNIAQFTWFICSYKTANCVTAVTVICHDNNTYKEKIKHSTFVKLVKTATATQ